MSQTLAGGTAIEWCDRTFNPWWGCEKVSPGCAHCYADTLAKRRQPGRRLWGEGHDFRFFGDGHWREPEKWARNDPAKLGRRPRIFCASMADVFEERDELEEHRERLFDLIVRTPELDWLVLTKRPEFARDWLGPSAAAYRNLWLGVSIENSRHTWRADVLREVPAAVRFISAEPLLGSLFDVRISGDKIFESHTDPMPERRKSLDLTAIDWVIIGGESGPGARPFHLEHAREIIHEATVGGAIRTALSDETVPIREEGNDPGPALFVKQLGAKPCQNGQRIKLASKKGGDLGEWPEDLRIREWPASAL